MIKYIEIKYMDNLPQRFIYKSGIINDIFTPFPIPQFNVIQHMYSFIENSAINDIAVFDKYIIKILK